MSSTIGSKRYTCRCPGKRDWRKGCRAKSLTKSSTLEPLLTRRSTKTTPEFALTKLGRICVRHRQITTVVSNVQKLPEWISNRQLLTRQGVAWISGTLTTFEFFLKRLSFSTNTDLMYTSGKKLFENPPLH